MSQLPQGSLGSPKWARSSCRRQPRVSHSPSIESRCWPSRRLCWALPSEPCDHLPLLHDVGQAVGHPRGGGQAVASGASGLLVVALDALRQVEVRDEPHVGLVDAHAERDGGDHHDAVLAEEARLVGRPHRRRQAGVVRQGGDALLAQCFGRLLHRLPRQAVDDAGVAVVLGADQLEELGDAAAASTRSGTGCSDGRSWPRTSARPAGSVARRSRAGCAASRSR